MGPRSWGFGYRGLLRHRANLTFPIEETVENSLDAIENVVVFTLVKTTCPNNLKIYTLSEKKKGGSASISRWTCDFEKK